MSRSFVRVSEGFDAEDGEGVPVASAYGNEVGMVRCKCGWETTWGLSNALQVKDKDGKEKEVGVATECYARLERGAWRKGCGYWSSLKTKAGRWIRRVVENLELGLRTDGRHLICETCKKPNLNPLEIWNSCESCRTILKKAGKKPRSTSPASRKSKTRISTCSAERTPGGRKTA